MDHSALELSAKSLQQEGCRSRKLLIDLLLLGFVWVRVQILHASKIDSPTLNPHRSAATKAPTTSNGRTLHNPRSQFYSSLRHVRASQAKHALSLLFAPALVVEKKSSKLPNPSQLKKMSGTGPSAAGLRRRTAGSASSKGRSSSAAAPGSQGGTAGSFSVRLYNDSAPGFKVGPFFVVMSSIVYLVVVVMLHMWGRVFAK